MQGGTARCVSATFEVSVHLLLGHFQDSALMNYAAIILCAAFHWDTFSVTYLTLWIEILRSVPSFREGRYIAMLEFQDLKADSFYLIMRWFFSSCYHSPYRWWHWLQSVENLCFDLWFWEIQEFFCLSKASLWYSKKSKQFVYGTASMWLGVNKLGFRAHALEGIMLWCLWFALQMWGAGLTFLSILADFSKATKPREPKFLQVITCSVWFKSLFMNQTD